jgi:hypothetical protein
MNDRRGFDLRIHVASRPKRRYSPPFHCDLIRDWQNSVCEIMAQFLQPFSQAPRSLLVRPLF